MDAHTLALELYSHGYAGTRQIADRMVAEDPKGVATVLSIHHLGPEMPHADDRARIDGPDGYGHADTGQPPKGLA